MNLPLTILSELSKNHNKKKFYETKRWWMWIMWNMHTIFWCFNFTFNISQFIIAFRILNVLFFNKNASKCKHKRHTTIKLIASQIIYKKKYIKGWWVSRFEMRERQFWDMCMLCGQRVFCVENLRARIFCRSVLLLSLVCTTIYRCICMDGHMGFKYKTERTHNHTHCMKYAHKLGIARAKKKNDEGKKLKRKMSTFTI